MIALPPVIGLPLAGLAYVVPGLALVRREEWKRAEPIELAAIACAGSIAWWAVGLWFIGFLRIPMSIFALVSLATAALALALYRRPEIVAALSTWRIARRDALFDFAFIAAVVATRALFAFTRLGCSVGDMSAHAYMAELIVMHDGLPATYEPFLPIGNFGSYPPGFHALAGIETLLGGVPTYRSTIHALCFALVALTFTLAALLRGVGIGRVGAALAAAGALMLGRHPQFFEMWGGAPTLLAAALAFLVLRDALRLVEPCPTDFLVRLGFFSAATLLVHQLPVVSFLYVFAAAAAFRAGRDRVSWGRIARNGVVVCAVAGALAAPFLLRAPRSIPPEVASWAHDWFRGETDRALRLQVPILRALGARGIAGEIGPQTWPFYLIIYLGVLPLALLILGLVVRWLRQRGSAATTLATALVGVNLVLFAGALTETLPLWPSLYPTRIGIWLAPALGIALAGLGSWVSGFVPRRVLLAGGAVWAGLFILEGYRLSNTKFGTAFYDAAKAGRTSALGVLANEAVGGAFWVATFNRDNAVLTADDLRGFDWVREHTPSGAVFATNYGDGGNLISAIAHRPVIAPHFNLAFFYSRELQEWALTPIDYVFVSSETSPAYPRRYVPEALDRDSTVELAFRAGDARVYRVRRP
ncbi:MAG TPA: hypothetical protein VIF32_12495 [Gemmatimonadaceae bacterium]